MHNDILKHLKKKVQSIVSNNDILLKDSKTEIELIGILNDLIILSKSAPMYAVAMVQYLYDNGFNINLLPIDQISEFKKIYGPKLSKITPDQLIQIKKISQSFFN
jgi:hypothetical protein